MRFGLRWKILILAAAAPVVLGPAALWLIGQSVSIQIRSDVEKSLRSAALVCENVLEARSRTLQTLAFVIAKDPRFFSALTVPDSNSSHFKATVREVANDFNKIARADLFEVLDSGGGMIASIGPNSSTAKGRGRVQKSASRQTSTGILSEKDALYQVTVTPVFAGGNIVGFLMLGSRIAGQLAGELQGLTQSDVSFLAGDSLVASTLPAGDRTALRDSFRKQFGASARRPQLGVIELKAGAKTYLTLAQPIPGASPSTHPCYITQRSLDDELAFFGSIERAMKELGILFVSAALIFGLMVSRRITGPVIKLVRGAEEMERGNYDYPIDVETQDEIGYLADRFREMRDRQRAYVSSLEEAARLKSEFLTVASHELRTPVSIIKGQSEFLSGGKLGSLSPEQKHALDLIERELDGIVRIIEDAVWITQVPEQRPVMHKGEHDVGDIVEGAVRIASADATSRWHRLTVEIKPGLGRAWIDGARIGQAVESLVRNAIRFTPDGGSVFIRARRQGNDIVILVKDSGIGVAEDKKQHLFDRSFMLRDSLGHHSSRTLEFNSAGLGLGLPLVRSIVEAHGGTISVESELGQGSSFTIRLPLERPPARVEAAA
jgi:signal transduction histidine kinase